MRYTATRRRVTTPRRRFCGRVVAKGEPMSRQPDRTLVRLPMGDPTADEWYTIHNEKSRQPVFYDGRWWLVWEADISGTPGGRGGAMYAFMLQETNPPTDD